MAKAADNQQLHTDHSSASVAHTQRHQQLIREILTRSYASEWKLAKLEWKLHYIYRARNQKQCLCGHFPIREICVLRNQRNGATASVGNVCVKKFLGIPTDKIFHALKRIEDSLDNRLNRQAIDYAHDQHWINLWEFDFYCNIWRKRKYTERQIHTLRKINQQVLLRFRQIHAES